MTLLTIMQGIADECSGPRPPTVVANTNPDAQNYLRIINRVGNSMMKSYAWDILRKEHTFTAGGTETLVASADMPSDFDRFVPETFWDRSAQNLFSGPINPAEWNSLKAYNPSIRNVKFIYRGGNVLSNPVVDSGASCAFEYVSNEYVLAADGVTYKTSFTADTDTSIIEEELLIRAGKVQWLMDEGQPWQQPFQDFREYYNTLVDNEMASQDILISADLFARNSRHSDGTPTASRTQFYGTY